MFLLAKFNYLAVNVKKGRNEENEYLQRPSIPSCLDAIPSTFGFAVPSSMFAHKYKLICRYPSAKKKEGKVNIVTNHNQ